MTVHLFKSTIQKSTLAETLNLSKRMFFILGNTAQSRQAGFVRCCLNNSRQYQGKSSQTAANLPFLLSLGIIFIVHIPVIAYLSAAAAYLSYGFGG